MDPKDIKEIKAIIDLMKKHDLSVFEIEKEGFRLKLQRGASARNRGCCHRLRPAVRPKAAVAAAETAACRTESDRKRADEGDRFAHGGHILSRCVAGRAAFC